MFSVWDIHISCMRHRGSYTSWLVKESINRCLGLMYPTSLGYETKVEIQLLSLYITTVSTSIATNATLMSIWNFIVKLQATSSILMWAILASTLVGKPSSCCSSIGYNAYLKQTNKYWCYNTNLSIFYLLTNPPSDRCISSTFNATQSTMYTLHRIASVI